MRGVDSVSDLTFSDIPWYVFVFVFHSAKFSRFLSQHQLNWSKAHIHTHTHKTNRAFFVRAARESRETELKLYPQVLFFLQGGFSPPPPLPFQPSQDRPCPKGTLLVLVVETVHSCRQNFPSLFFSGTFSTLLLRTTAAEWAFKATFPEFPLKFFFLLRGKGNWEANRYETVSVWNVFASLLRRKSTCVTMPGFLGTLRDTL